MALRFEEGKDGKGMGLRMTITEDCNMMLKTAPREVLVMTAYALAAMLVASAGGKAEVEPMPDNIRADFKAGRIDAGDVLEQTMAGIGAKIIRAMILAEARKFREATTKRKEESERSDPPEEPEPAITDVAAAAELLRQFQANGKPN
jgi:hypothetical protein